MFLDIFQYGFIIRGLEAGIIVAIIAPLIGIFLVLRRYSLIADTLAHVSLAGIAIGLFFGINPVLTALVTAVLASLGIERLRTSKTVYGESALADILRFIHPYRTLLGGVARLHMEIIRRLHALFPCGRIDVHRFANIARFEIHVARERLVDPFLCTCGDFNESGRRSAE